MLDRRAVERIPIAAGVDCTVCGGAEPATAYDISADGCMLQTSYGLLDPGDPIRLDFGREIVAAGRIAWIKHRNAGIQFAPPIGPSQVAAIVRAGHARQREALPPAAVGQWGARRVAATLGGVIQDERANFYATLQYAWCALIICACAGVLAFSH